MPGCVSFTENPADSLWGKPACRINMFQYRQSRQLVRQKILNDKI